MSTAVAALRSLRPRHWVKNAFVLAPVIFVRRFTEPEFLIPVLETFAVFCAVSSAVYVINDLADRQIDRLHPVKRNRPIAAGLLSVPAAWVLAVVLAGGSLLTAAWLSTPLLYIVAGYLGLNLAYSFHLKKLAVLDVMVVSAGFLLRAWGGAAVIDVAMSRWLVLCTGLLALLLGFVKRRQELVAWSGAGEHRPALRNYTLPFLDQLISVVTACTILAYALYAFSPETAEKLGTPWMGATLPFVFYGIFRYLQRVHGDGAGENPTRLILGDPPLRWTLLLWGLTVLFLLHGT